MNRMACEARLRLVSSMSRCLVGVHLVTAVATGSASILCARGLVRCLNQRGPQSLTRQERTHTAISCPEMAADLAEPADQTMRPHAHAGSPDGEPTRQVEPEGCLQAATIHLPVELLSTECSVTASCMNDRREKESRGCQRAVTPNRFSPPRVTRSQAWSPSSPGLSAPAPLPYRFIAA